MAKWEVNGKSAREKSLGDIQIESFNAFAEKLRNYEESSGCTSITTYALYTKHQIIRKTDASCDLEDIFALKTKLGYK